MPLDVSEVDGSAMGERAKETGSGGGRGQVQETRRGSSVAVFVTAINHASQASYAGTVV